MAITINSSSQEYSHSGNPLVFVFSSDETAQANFSYAVEVSVNGTLVERHKIFPESGIYAHFDASDVCERYCNVPTKTDSILIDSGSTIELLINVIENYGTPPVDVLNDNITINVLKGKLTKRNFLTYDGTNYIFAANKKWLTLYPRTQKRFINLTYPNKFSFITDENTFDYIVNLYDIDGNLIELEGIGEMQIENNFLID